QFQIEALILIEVRMLQQLGGGGHAIQGGANSVADIGEKLILGEAGLFGLRARFREMVARVQCLPVSAIQRNRQAQDVRQKGDQQQSDQHPRRTVVNVQQRDEQWRR